MLVSVAIAMGFSYPSILLSENPTAGLAAYPHHVWTTAKSVDNSTAKVDVEMRQIWIHGTYMNALNKAVLKQALAVQQSIVGEENINNMIPALDDRLRNGTLQWGYHSPLMYWNNSEDLIDSDPDILATINNQKHASTSLNVILRPASVFAGKKFSRRQLLAADALVITLMNKVDDDAGQQWQQQMKALADGTCQNCTLFPSNGHVLRQRTYEFSFTPLSVSEHVALTFAYSFMAIYVLVSLRRMRAFHSRFGLVVTAITQMTCSILASFTICGILKINLSMIPQNAYPFVVLVLGVENMFRLINAVVAYPPTMATELRIANALGDIGPISVAAAAQNLTILATLSTVVSPGVAAFCAFAAIATLFDTFFLLTFFVAVLNVDIRRLELQDALAARHGQTRHRRRQSPVHHTWFDALVQGRLPFSTRMAGTAVTTTFVLSLNYHFFEHRESATTLRHLLDLVRGGPPSVADLDTFAPPPINATLTPGEWMRMQDFDTAKEVMRLAKPGADAFIIRLFAPLVIVLEGADRTGVSGARAQWSHALRSFAIHHFYPVAVAVVFAVAFVAVLMNFLLYNDAGDEDNDLALNELEDSLSVHTVELPHKLDVVRLASSPGGHFITAALDRTLAVSTLDQVHQTHHTMAIPESILARIGWPIRHLAIDENGEWIACHCADDQVVGYNCSTGSVASVQYPDDHPALIFDFVWLPASAGSRLYFLALSSGGKLIMKRMDDGTSHATDLTRMPLVAASISDSVTRGRQLVVVTEDAHAISHIWSSGAWVAACINSLPIEVTAFGRLSGSMAVQTYCDLDTELVVVTTASHAVFLEGASLTPMTTFQLSEEGTYVDSFLIGSSRKCPSCGSLALRKVAASSTNDRTGEVVMTTWHADDDQDACICLSQTSSTCRSLEQAVKDKQIISAPGARTAVKSQAVLGLHRRRQQSSKVDSNPTRSVYAQVRRRRNARQGAQAEEAYGQWEAYKLSIDGALETLELHSDAAKGADDDNALYVDSAGPIITLDSQAVAVAFGNTVKVIRSSRRGSMSRLVASLERQPSTARRVRGR